MLPIIDKFLLNKKKEKNLSSSLIFFNIKNILKNISENMREC